MGCFHLFEHGSQETSNYESMSHEEDTPLHPLTADNLSKEDTTIDFDFSSFWPWIVLRLSRGPGKARKPSAE